MIPNNIPKSVIIRPITSCCKPLYCSNDELIKKDKLFPSNGELIKKDKSFPSNGELINELSGELAPEGLTPGPAAPPLVLFLSIIFDF